MADAAAVVVKYHLITDTAKAPVLVVPPDWGRYDLFSDQDVEVASGADAHAIATGLRLLFPSGTPINARIIPIPDTGICALGDTRDDKTFEVKVLVTNRSASNPILRVSRGDRIAQLLFAGANRIVLAEEEDQPRNLEGVKDAIAASDKQLS